MLQFLYKCSKYNLNKQKMTTAYNFLDKLQRLKQQATIAQDLSSLDKVSTKVSKIKNKLNSYQDNKQLKVIVDKIDLLIKEKNKYFTQKTVKNSARRIDEQTVRNAEADRTLKFSKSAENLKSISRSQKIDMATNKNYSHIKYNRVEDLTNNQLDCFNKGLNKQKQVYYPDNQRSIMENQYLQISSAKMPQDLQKSQRQKNNKGFLRTNSSSMKNIQKCLEQHQLNGQKSTTLKAGWQESRNLKNQIDFLQQKLAFSFKQIQDLNKKIASTQLNKTKQESSVSSPIALNYLKKHENIVDDYSRKIRQKNFIIQDLKAKVDYAKSMSQQFKIRAINQQRRSQDYIGGLKQQIKDLKKQMQRYKRENQIYRSDLDQLQNKNEQLMNEIKKLVSKLHEQSKNKQLKSKQAAIATSSRVQQLQKQIKRLNLSVTQKQKLESILQEQIGKRNQLEQSKGKMQAKLDQLIIQNKNIHDSRDKIQLQYFKLDQQIKILRLQLKTSAQTKNILAQQLLQMRQNLQIHSKKASMLQFEESLKAKNKLSKLKEIKSLLSQLK